MILQPPELMPYFTAGWPSAEGFLASARGARKAGCRVVEVGIPFTDPVADGPVIQATSHAALSAGFGWKRSLELNARMVQETGLAPIAMTYTNLVFHPGLDKACQELKEAGFQALILPDLALEEGEPYEQATQKAGLDLVYLCSPTTPTERIAELGRRTRGFLYLVAVRGVTGARSQLSADLGELIGRVRSVYKGNLCVGFGISTPEQAVEVARQAEGVIVGSALLRHIQDLAPEAIESGVASYLGAMRPGRS